MNDKDVEIVAQIWLNSNLEAHKFIDPKYWQKNYSVVKNQFLQAEVYVYLIQNRIIGFIGLQDNYVAGLFIEKKNRNKHVGQKLLNYVKQSHEQLELNVYERNKKAVEFYLHNNFEIVDKSIESATKMSNLKMLWNKSQSVVNA